MIIHSFFLINSLEILIPIINFMETPDQIFTGKRGRPKLNLTPEQKIIRRRLINKKAAKNFRERIKVRKLEDEQLREENERKIALNNRIELLNKNIDHWKKKLLEHKDCDFHKFVVTKESVKTEDGPF